LNSIACIGGLVWDETIVPSGEMIQGTSNPVTSSTSLGGVAHNIAAGLAGLEVNVSLFSIVGLDPVGDELLNRLSAGSIDASRVARSNAASTARYTAVLDPQGELIYGLADMEIFSELDVAWCDLNEESLAKYRVWVLDANLPPPTLSRLLLGMRGVATILVDPVSVAKADRLKGLLGGIDVLFPDRQEAAALGDLPTESTRQVEAAAARLLELGSKRVVVSLGGAGVCVADESGIEHKSALPVEGLCDVTGAGDALVAGYVYGLLDEGDSDPVDFGLAAASLVLESSGASVKNLSPKRLVERLRRI
jgi:pseudouridine kinase